MLHLTHGFVQHIKAPLKVFWRHAIFTVEGFDQEFLNISLVVRVALRGKQPGHVEQILVELHVLYAILQHEAEIKHNINSFIALGFVNVLHFICIFGLWLSYLLPKGWWKGMDVKYKD